MKNSDRKQTGTVKKKGPHQLLPGTRYDRCRCSLPGLTGFTADRREVAGADQYIVSQASAALSPPLWPRTGTGQRYNARMVDGNINAASCTCG